MKYLKFIIIFIGLVGVVGIVKFTQRSTDQIVVDINDYKNHVDDKDTIRIDLSKVAKTYQGIDKANFLSYLGRDLLLAERKIFMSVLVDGIHYDKTETTIEVINAIPKMKLQKDELLSLSKAICEQQKINTELRAKVKNFCIN